MANQEKKKKTTARTNVMFQGTTDILKLEISLDSVLNFMLHRTVWNCHRDSLIDVFSVHVSATSA